MDLETLFIYALSPFVISIIGMVVIVAVGTWDMNKKKH
tara:strand:+ start:564 stop:677 length:114 start_codon:yes stop_codon:yes gene_type:complete